MYAGLSLIVGLSVAAILLAGAAGQDVFAHKNPESNVDESADHDGHVFYIEYIPHQPDNPMGNITLRFLAVMHKAGPYDWALTFRNGSDPIARDGQLDGSFDWPPADANNVTMRLESTLNYRIPYGQQYTFGITGRGATESAHVDLDITSELQGVSRRDRFALTEIRALTDTGVVYSITTINNERRTGHLTDDPLGSTKKIAPFEYTPTEFLQEEFMTATGLRPDTLHFILVSRHPGDFIFADHNIIFTTLADSPANLTASNDTASARGLEPVLIDVLTNDDISPVDAQVQIDIVSNSTGTVTVNQNNTITYVSDANRDFTETFTYRLSTELGLIASEANVTVTVEEDPIDAVDDTAETTANTSVEINVLDNDTYDTGGPPVVPQVTTQPDHGTVELTATDGVFRYTPETDYTGQDTFVYEITDPVSSQSDSATVTVTIAEVTPVVTATPRPYFDHGRGAHLVNIDVTPHFEILLYGRMLRADNTLFSSFTPRTIFPNAVNVEFVARSFTSLDPNTMYFYEFSRNADYTGDDTVRGSFTTGPAPLTAQNRSETIPEDSEAITITPRISGDGATITAITEPTLGAASHDTTTITYTPDANVHGTEMINYTVTDSSGATTGTITITIESVNDLPAFGDIETRHSTIVNMSFTLDATATDADAQTVSYEITSHNATGAAPAINPDNGTISWTPNMTQTASITVRASDDQTPAGTANITVIVTVAEIVARDDMATSNKVDILHIHATANDAPADARITELDLRMLPSSHPTLGAITHNGTHITYEPSAEDAGHPDGLELIFGYTLTSQDGTLQAEAGVTIVLLSEPTPNAPPVARDFAVTVAPSGNVTVNLTEAGHISDAEQEAGNLTVAIDATPAPTQGTASIDRGLFTYQAGDDAAGSDTLSYTVTDAGNLTDSGTITVNISPPAGEPQPPEPEPEPVLQAPDIDVEAIPGMLTRVQPDIGAGNTIESATGATMGMITEGFLNLGTIAYTADAGESGIDEVTYTVSGGNETAQGTVYFHINAEGNQRPALEAIPGVQTDGTVTFAVEATDGDDDQLTYAIRNAPDGATIDGTGAFGWDSAGSDPGDYIFNVVVHDDTGGLAQQKMAITVSDPANDSPTAPVVHRRTTSGTSILVTPDIRDPEGQPTSMILAVGADRGNIREGFLEANIIAYVPDQTGTDIISYTTSDGAGGATTSTVYIHTGTSADPDLGAIGVQRTETSETLTFTASAKDDDSTDISYIMSGAPDGATLDESTGQFSWTPAAADAGDHTFTITAYDGQGGFDTEPVAVSVSAPGTANQNPNISDFDSAARQNNPRFIALQTSDPDGDPTSIILATNTTTGTILQDSLRFGIVAYVPGIDDTGTDTVTYVISDGRGGASTGTIYVHVRDPDNDEPTLDAIGIKQVDAPNELTFDVTATDNDEGDTLTYAIRNAPAGATIDSATGAFSWTPAAADAGDHTFTVAVHDTGGGFATEDITVTVTDTTSANLPPTAPDDSATTSGSRTSILPDIDDPDGDDLTIIAATGAVQGLVDAELLADAIVAYTPFEGAFGTETITYTVSDGNGGTATGTITITISASEQPSTPPPTNTATSVYNPATGAMIDSSTIPQDIADSNNAFAIDFYQTILEAQEGKNIFFSPASMYVAFSALYEGARENTASQIQNTFGFEPDDTARHNSTAHAIASINRDDPDATLDMANALWLADWFEPYDSYLDIARRTYLTDTEEVSFTDDDDGVKRINDWAAEKTNDKIDKVITPRDVNDLTAMVITNAIYFKGTWVTQFSKEDTDKGDFWTGGDQSTEADFMHVADRFSYTRSDGAQVLKMSYEGDRLSMLIILPDERDGLASLEETISAQQIDRWIRDLTDQDVSVTMPKFEMETGYDLKTPLERLGVTDAFDEILADLGNIAYVEPDRNLYVTATTQDAYVKVDEEGTEASAVTKIIIGLEGTLPFIANHPFLFIIYDEESGMNLFMGRVSDPTA